MQHTHSGDTKALLLDSPRFFLINRVTEAPITLAHPGTTALRALYLWESAEGADDQRRWMNLAPDAIEVRNAPAFYDGWTSLMKATADAIPVVLFVETDGQVRPWAPNPSVTLTSGFLEVDAASAHAFEAVQVRGYASGRPPFVSGELAASGRPGVEHDYVWMEAGNVAAALVSVPFVSCWDRARLSLEGIGGVVAPPEYRRRGHTAQLLAHTVAQMRERGVALSAITTPFSYPFYRKAGWEYAFRRVHYRFPPKAIAHLRGEDGQVRFYDYDPVQAGLPVALARIYEASLAPAYQGYAERSAEQWQAHLSGDRTYVYVWEGAGPAQGYVLCQFKADEVIVIRELMATDKTAFRGLLAFLANFDSQAEYLEWDALPGIRLDRLISEPLWLTETWRPRGLFRVIDVARAMTARQFSPTVRGVLTVHLDDERSPWNQGVWRFCWDAGHVQATLTSEQSADADLTLSAFSLLFAGSISVQDAEQDYGARLSPSARDLMAAAFGSKIPVFLETF